MNRLSNLETLTPSLHALLTVAMVMQQQCLAVWSVFSKAHCSFHFSGLCLLSKFPLHGDDPTAPAEHVCIGVCNTADSVSAYVSVCSQKDNQDLECNY